MTPEIMSTVYSVVPGVQSRVRGSGSSGYLVTATGIYPRHVCHLNAMSTPWDLNFWSLNVFENWSASVIKIKWHAVWMRHEVFLYDRDERFWQVIHSRKLSVTSYFPTVGGRCSTFLCTFWVPLNRGLCV